MKKILLASILLLTFKANAQKKIDLTPFKAIVINSSLDVVLLQDTSHYISFEDKDFDASKIITNVNDGRLSFSFTDGEKPDGNITIGFIKIDNLAISGSGDVKGNMLIRSDKMDINKTGSGDLEMELIANSLEVNQTGSGDVELSGNTGSLAVNKTGSGEFESYQLITSNVTANATGAGTVKIYVSDTLKANASGIGDILYIGKPKDVNVNIAGAGTVREVPFVEKSNTDTTRLKIGGKKIIILDEDEDDEKEEKEVTLNTKKNYKVKDIYRGFEIGVNGYMNSSNSFNVEKPYDYLSLNYAKSINLNLNVAEWHIKLYKNNIALTTGAGFEFNRYFFSKSNMGLQPLKDTVSALAFPVDYSKNILKVSYITVPLLLQFNTHANPKKAFHIAVGGYGSFNVSNKLKQLYTFNGTEYTTKTYDKNNFNLNPFKYGLMARVGYKNINLYATYAMSELFNQKTTGPVLHPFSVGISLIPF